MFELYVLNIFDELSKGEIDIDTAVDMIKIEAAERIAKLNEDMRAAEEQDLRAEEDAYYNELYEAVNPLNIDDAVEDW